MRLQNLLHIFALNFYLYLFRTINYSVREMFDKKYNMVVIILDSEYEFLNNYNQVA